MSQENVEIVQRAWDLLTESIDRGYPATGSNAAAAPVPFSSPAR